MGLKTIAAGGRASQGGAGATIQILDDFERASALQPGLNPGWTDGGWSRYGPNAPSINGLPSFGSGSAGATPNRGYAVARGMAWRRARNTAAGNVPIDWFSHLCPYPIVEQPVAPIADPMQDFEVSVIMMLDSTPTAPITRDCGLVFVMANVTTFANCLRAGVAVGNDYAGFGVVFDGNTGNLLWICKKSGASGGAALTESVSLGTYPANRPLHVRVLFESARVGREARLSIFLDTVGPVLVRSWGPGTVLPVAADATFSAQLGFFRPMMRAAQAPGDTSALLFRRFQVRAASNATFFDPQV